MTTIKAKINNKKLKQMIKEMSKTVSLKIGLLASQGGSMAISDDMDLAGIGAVQEFGADIKITPKMAKYLAIKAKELGLPKKQGKGDGYVHIPARSFLYAPLTDKNFMKLLKDELDPELTTLMLSEYGGAKDVAEEIGALGLLQVQKAFDNHGINGEWAPNSPFTVASKGSSMQLVDEGTLRHQISYEVTEK